MKARFDQTVKQAARRGVRAAVAAVAVALAALLPAKGADWYVAPGGTGDGLSSPAPLVSTVLANEALADNDIIHVAAGDYEETARLVITNAISVIGDGYKTTTITQVTADQGGLRLGHVNAVCQGISFLSTATHTADVAGVSIVAGTLLDCRIANWNGARGLSLLNSNKEGAVADRCIIEGNYKSNNGGGVYMRYDAILRNSLVRNNRAGTTGGGIFANGNSKTLNCTIVGNTAGSNGGGIYVEYVGNDKATIANCIIRGNKAPADTGDYSPELYFKGGQTTKNCLLGTTKKSVPSTCFTGDPCYACEATGFYYILSDSAAKDEGVDTYATYTGDYDLAGNPRKVGDAYDVGCYEYNPDKLVCWFSSDVTEGHTARDFTFTSGYSGATGNETYAWEFLNETTGNTTTSDVANPVFSPTEMGYYSVSLVVTAGGQTANYYMGTYLDVRSPVCYVDANATSPVYPYDTPETATTDLAAAYEACGAGGEVIINSVKFTAKTSKTFSRGVIISGKTANAADAVIDLNSKDVRFTLNHPNASIQNLTIKNGGSVDSSSGVVQIGSKGGLVSNCVFSGNKSLAVKMLAGRVTGCSFTASGNWKGEGCAIVNGNSAQFDHCIVSDYNHSAEWGSSLILLSAGTISDCLIKDNKHCKATVQVAGENTVLRNCTIINNKRQSGYTLYGGIYWSQNVGSRIVNCVVAGNTNYSSASDIVKSGTAKDSYLPQVFVNNCVLNTDIGTSCVTVASIDDLKLTAEYVPTRESPLVDAGTDAYGISERDLAGMIRVMGNAVDIGAYEFNPVECDFVASTTNTYKGAAITLTAKPTAASGSQTYAWTVTHDEGIVETVTSTAEQFSFVVSELGAYSVKLVMTDGGNDLVKERKAYIKVSEYSCDFTVDVEKGLKDSVFHFTSIVSGVSSGITYKWTFKNEQTGDIETSTEKDPSYVASAIGQITVTLEVTSSLGTISKKKDSVITVQPKICYANPKNENATFPYDTWDKAASNIYDAVSTCGEGGEVILASETFVLTNTVYLNKPITVRGVGAREDTILKIKPNDKYIVSVQNEQATLKNVTLTGATAGSWSYAGLNITDGLVTNCVVRDNVASGTYAGPAAVVVTGGRLTGSLVCNNKGGHAHVATLAIWGDVNKVAAGRGPIIDHCTIVSNGMSSTSGSCEGTVGISMGIMHDCLIADNSCGAGSTAGVKIDGYGTMYNCTITRNKSGGAAAGGLYWNNQPLARIVNCVVVGNENLTGNEISKASTAKDSELKNSFVNCVLAATNIVWGTNCKVAGTEIYKDYNNGDFTPASGSAPVDMGITSWKAINSKVTVTIVTNDVDYAGEKRIMGKTVDAGACEYDPYVLSCSFAAVGKAESFVGSMFCLTGIVSGASGEVEYDWTVSKGETVMRFTGITPSFTLTEAGYYDVELVATAPNGVVRASSVNFLHAVPREFTVTPGGMTFEEAVGQSIDGCTINVSGTNEVKSCVYVNNAVTIVGVNGAANASLYGQVDREGIGSHGIVYLNNAQAVLRGVTVSKGGVHSQYGAGGGIYISSKGGIVEDCIVENNGLSHYGCGAGIYVAEGATSAVVRRTIIRNNKTTSGYSGAGVYLGAGVLENCFVSGNYGSAFGGAVAIGSEKAHVRNCTIVNHSVSPLCFRTTSVDGGSPEVVNTIIADNSTLDANTNRVYMSWCYGTQNQTQVMTETATNNIAAAVSYCAFDHNKVLPGMTNVLVMASDDMGFAVYRHTTTRKPTYELGQESPLRDAGLNQDWMLEEGVTDLYGLPRIDKTKVDIGCSEAKLKFGTVFTIK